MLFTHILLAYMLFILASTFVLFSFATDEDISGLPKEKKERFLILLYCATSTFTTAGYGDVVPKSLRARMFMTAYMFASMGGILYVSAHKIL